MGTGIGSHEEHEGENQSGVAREQQSFDRHGAATIVTRE